MSKNTGTSELINYFTLGASGAVDIGGNLTLSTIANATTDTDKFLVSDTGIIKYRTGAELLTDIGAAPAVAGGYVPYTGAGANVDLGVYDLTANAVNVNGSGSSAGVINLESNTIFSLVNGYGTIGSGTTNQFNLYQTTGAGVFRGAILSLNSITASATRTFTLPDADGTLALTSSLAAYLPLAGGTLTGALNGTSATFTTTGNQLTINGSGNSSPASIRMNGTTSTGANYGTAIFQADAITGGSTPVLNIQTINAAGSAFVTALSINTSQAATFSSSIQVGSGTYSSGLAKLYTDSTYGTILTGKSGSSSDMLLTDRSGNIALQIIANSSTPNVVINGGGNVLIGTTTDNGARLQVSGSARVDSEYAYYWQRTSGGSNLWSWSANSSSSYLYNHTTATPVLTFLNNGSVGIGTTTPDVTGFGWTTLTIKGGPITGNAGVIELQNTVSVSNDQNLGIIAFLDGTSRNAQISVRRESSTSTAHMDFFTNAGAGLVERMRISSDGDIGIGADSNSLVRLLTRGKDSGTVNYAFIAQNSSATNLFLIRNDGAASFFSLGTGTVTATAGTLSTVSDSSFKTDDGFIDSALDKVLNLKPRYFYWNEKSGLPMDVRQLGFYAQEVNEALGEEAANTPANKDTPWGITDRSMIAMLTKAVQEQQVQIQELKNKLS